MSSSYPTSFDNLRAWAKTSRVSVTEAGKRLAQYSILRSIVGSRALSAMLVLKGGNALDFVWQPNRSTTDLDFSADMETVRSAIPDWDPARLLAYLKQHLERGVQTESRRSGVALRVHRITQQPPRATSVFITYEARIGYALPGDSRNRERLEQGGSSTSVIPVEISLNEPICADELIALDEQSSARLRVSTVEDIVAEKLRALLQQPIRDRTREQDLLDIAVRLANYPQLDREKVAEYLLQKAAARDVPVSRAAFKNTEVAARAKQNYLALKSVARTTFIPFDQAIQILYDFVDALEIPEAL